MSKWLKNDIDYLIENYTKYSDTELSSMLNRTTGAISAKRDRLNLLKNITVIKKKIKCLNCGATFEIYDVESRKNAKFCCKKCKYEYTKKIPSGSIKTCLECGKEFNVVGNPKNRNFCSKECDKLHRKNGKIIKCCNCGKEVYKRAANIKRSKNLFCGIKCANEFQKCEKIKIICKTCGKEFESYPSSIKHVELIGYKRQYCSLSCRYKDPDKIQQLIRMNYNQSRKKKLNKLETKGSLLLKTLIDNFEEQYLINNKITVDIYIPDQNLIIQWWGDYWHCNPIFIKNKTPNKTQIKRMNSDKSQHNYLTKCGYKILYFWENEVHKNSNMVLEKIKSELFSF